MKLFIKLIVFVGIIYLGWNFFIAKKDSQPLISFSDQNGSFSINIRDKEREEFKFYLKKVKNLVYREATVHNPPGDMLPDNIDNSLIDETKKIVN